MRQVFRANSIFLWLTPRSPVVHHLSAWSFMMIFTGKAVWNVCIMRREVVFLSGSNLKMRHFDSYGRDNWRKTDGIRRVVPASSSNL